MTHQFKVRDSETIKDLWYAYCAIKSSTDHPFAISDTFQKYLPETKESLLIVAPDVSKSFIDRIRPSLKRARIKFLTKVPNEKNDWTIRAIESLIQIANSLGLNLNIKCKHKLHSKFIVIDNRIVLSGSPNLTSSAMWDNDELLYVFVHPHPFVKQHVEIFDRLWSCPRNTTWENIQLYSGYKRDYNRYSLHDEIAEKIVGLFYLNHNRPTHKGVLVQKMEDKGYKREDVVEVIRNLLYNSPAVLWEPKRDMLQLTDYQADINDF